MSIERRTVPGHHRVQVLVDTGAEGSGPTLWPSVGEYPCYDALLYHVMTSDTVRLRAYRAAIRSLVPGREVLDIGTGRDMNWALEAAASGARHVVACESIEQSATLAEETLARSGMADRVELVRSASTQLALARPAEVCVSEIIGSIGGAEGAAAVLRDARRRLLAPDGVLIPHRCVTMAGAVSVRDLLPRVAFSSLGAPYLNEIFAAAGHPFDVRLMVTGVRHTILMTDAAGLEDLQFNGDLRPEGDESAVLTVRLAGRIDGLLLWIKLWCFAEDEPVDALVQRTCWSPVYLPLFDEPLAVAAGDRLNVRLSRRLSDDGVHPDYVVAATLQRGDSVERASFMSSHHGDAFRSHRLYRELFPIA